MANTYTKLFQSILDSTIWLESPETKVVWVTMLAMADWDGVVWASVPGLAHRAGVELEDCRKALGKFLGPDPESRTTENEGRRVELVDGGWRLLNHGKYRAMLSAEERREYNRLKQAEYRSKKPKSGKSRAQVRAENESRERRSVAAQENGDEPAADAIAAEGLAEGPAVQEMVKRINRGDFDGAAQAAGLGAG